MDSIPPRVEISAPWIEKESCEAAPLINLHKRGIEKWTNIQSKEMPRPKIVQVLGKGGGKWSECREMVPATKEEENNMRGDFVSTPKNKTCCPPYLLVSDGKTYAAVFLPPNVSPDSPELPERGSFVKICHWAISSVVACAGIQFDHLKSDSKEAHLPAPICLTLQVGGKIEKIGEKTDIIGNPVEVNFSAEIKKALLELGDRKFLWRRHFCEKWHCRLSPGHSSELLTEAAPHQANLDFFLIQYVNALSGNLKRSEVDQSTIEQFVRVHFQAEFNESHERIIRERLAFFLQDPASEDAGQLCSQEPSIESNPTPKHQFEINVQSKKGCTQGAKNKSNTKENLAPTTRPPSSLDEAESPSSAHPAPFDMSVGSDENHNESELEQPIGYDTQPRIRSQDIFEETEAPSRQDDTEQCAETQTLSQEEGNTSENIERNLRSDACSNSDNAHQSPRETNKKGMEKHYWTLGKRMLLQKKQRVTHPDPEHMDANDSTVDTDNSEDANLPTHNIEDENDIERSNQKSRDQPMDFRDDSKDISFIHCTEHEAMHGRDVGKGLREVNSDEADFHESDVEMPDDVNTLVSITDDERVQTRMSVDPLTAFNVEYNNDGDSVIDMEQLQSSEEESFGTANDEEGNCTEISLFSSRGKVNSDPLTSRPETVFVLDDDFFPRFYADDEFDSESFGTSEMTSSQSQDSQRRNIYSSDDVQRLKRKIAHESAVGGKNTENTKQQIQTTRRNQRKASIEPCRDNDGTV